ncbi:hypothetical protein MLD38_029195 [Melastoma candidum]|uniref:Uncharacterized protein n=1 Tax=Melastoma candidum TaxID=119954 RepID=A0ACB9N380_9MYRT|nr:hypothetical protein MLD38_029195 [Melastoma candidum]
MAPSSGNGSSHVKGHPGETWSWSMSGALNEGRSPLDPGSEQWGCGLWQGFLRGVRLLGSVEEPSLVDGSPERSGSLLHEVGLIVLFRSAENEGVTSPGTADHSRFVIAGSRLRGLGLTWAAGLSRTPRAAGLGWVAVFRVDDHGYFNIAGNRLRGVGTPDGGWSFIVNSGGLLEASWSCW